MKMVPERIHYSQFVLVKFLCLHGVVVADKQNHKASSKKKPAIQKYKSKYKFKEYNNIIWIGERPDANMTPPDFS